MGDFSSAEDVTRLLLEKMDILMSDVAEMNAKLTAMSKRLEETSAANCQRCIQHATNDDTEAITSKTKSLASKHDRNQFDEDELEVHKVVTMAAQAGDASVPRDMPHDQGHADMRSKGHTENTSLQMQRRRVRRSTGDSKEDRLGRALQQNIVTMVENVPFSSCELADYLINSGCLTEDECGVIRKSPNPKDEIRTLVRLIKGRSYRVIKSFLDCMEKFSPDVTKVIWSTFEKNKTLDTSKTLCMFCKLKQSVDIRLIADHVWSIGAISDEVYEEAVSYNHSTESLDGVWSRLAAECNQCIDVKPVIDKIFQALTAKGHYSHITKHLRRESRLICRCSAMHNIRDLLCTSFILPNDTDVDDGDVTVSPRSSIDVIDRDSLMESDSTEDDVMSPIANPNENIHVRFLLPKYSSIIKAFHVEDTIDELDYVDNDSGDWMRSNSVGKDPRKRKDIDINVSNRRRASLPVTLSWPIIHEFLT